MRFNEYERLVNSYQACDEEYGALVEKNVGKTMSLSKRTKMSAYFHWLYIVLKQSDSYRTVRMFC